MRHARFVVWNFMSGLVGGGCLAAFAVAQTELVNHPPWDLAVALGIGAGFGLLTAWE